MKPLFLLFLVFQQVLLYAQSDTLNRLDATGERTGWWIVYLDDNLDQVKDSSSATHFHYTLYKGKFNYYNMGAIGSDKAPVIFPESDTLVIDGIKLLNGVYRSNFKNGKTRFELTVVNGIFVDYKEYYENGNIHTHFKYTTECGTPFQGCILMYNKDGSLKFEGTNRIPE